MKKTTSSFIQNQFAISLMYDAVFFVVLVSLSGVVLIPALQSNIAIEGSLDKHREHVADEALNTLLVSRADKFSYKIAGDIIDDVAGGIGIDNSSDSGLYSFILSWLLAHEQLHKTYANLIAENLGCQFKLPFSAFGTSRFNIFTGDYDRQLKKEIKIFLTSCLGNKYGFNFTALWHPIKGIPLGGDIYIGAKPPGRDCYVAESSIIMPYKPVVAVNGTEVVFTRYWFEENILKNISETTNITDVINSYKAGFPPYDNSTNASNAVSENLSKLIHGFLVDGIQNVDNEILFPGIVNLTITYSFNKVKNAVANFTENAMKNVMGEALGTVDNIFENIGGVVDPLADAIKNKLNDTLSNLLGSTFGTLSMGFDLLEETIKNEVSTLISSFINLYIKDFIDSVFDQINTIDIYGFLSEWLFDRISVNKAEVSLIVWEVR
ncbi:MAG: hypothetical protein DRM98_01920 [Thermoplasmata archaeon]|nr:MAG: hypothetical protein DRM98_01920 [Thermoplasmata archaeon]